MNAARARKAAFVLLTVLNLVVVPVLFARWGEDPVRSEASETRG